MSRFILYTLILFVHFSYAQYPLDNKRDHIWMFGYDNSPPNFGGTCLDFNQNPPSISYITQQINMGVTDASVCDQVGNLIFYTNAMYVANANHQIMPNGDTLNPGAVFNWYAGYGYRMPQGALILPLPGSTNLYYILHQKLEFSDDFFMLSQGFYYTIVDMDLEGGLGDVTDKNILLIDDTLDFGCISATRHANGRDWWILIPKFGANKYYRIMLSTSGLTIDTTQTIGNASYYPELSQVCFSPDGTKYVRYGGISINDPYRLEVFDFDRCTGTLSNYRDLWYVDTAWACGVAISPNSEFLYVSADKRIDQYNLNSPDIASTRQVVAIYDGFTDPEFSICETRFFLEQLGSDNKIYINCPGSNRFLSVIDQPDNEGISCNVLQHAIQLNTFNSSSMPNFPNFRLGPIDGSICDSLGINIVTSTTINNYKNNLELTIWPNPACTYFNYKIETPSNKNDFIITLSDEAGRYIQKWVINSNQTIGNLNISHLKKGLYILNIHALGNEKMEINKLFIKQ